ncbi:MAG: hypothetical protein IPI49_04465 [Myxococcales bacterium]|nr:hypothetical protein [Myxococcales bacterium]
MKLIGERRALASSVLIFYAFLYALVAIASPLPEWMPAYLALASVYALGFFAVVAGYFWARWYAIGVSLFGAISAAVGMWQMGPEPLLLILGGSHLFIAVALSGESMQGPFEGQEQWRLRFHMDDHAVRRLGRSVMRAAFGLPYVLLYALAPKPGNALVFAAAMLAVAGVAGLVRLRTWSVFALGGAGVAMAVGGVMAMASGTGCSVGFAPLAGALIFTTAVTPFAAPLARALRGPA